MSLPNPLVVLGAPGSPYTRKMLSYLRYKRIPHKMIWGDPSKYCLLYTSPSPRDRG